MNALYLCVRANKNMKQKIITPLFLMALSFLSVSIINCAGSNDNFSYSEIEPEYIDSTDLINLIENLDNMTKVNDKPFVVSEMLIVLCRIPSDAETITQKHDGPHKGMAINVYVNDIGKSAMTQIKNPHYPIGTVIIKEKFPFEFNDTVHPKEVELYTIMIKRAKGYNPECGDWEFAAINGDLGESKQGKLESCIKCHKTKDEMDYVFSDDYLAEKYRNKINHLP
jgi:hypothetical protein